jgi:hypothetical protein
MERSSRRLGDPFRYAKIPNQMSMNSTLIVELPYSNISCFEDRIQYGRLLGAQDKTILFSSVSHVLFQRTISLFAVAFILFAIGLLLLAFAVFSSIWVRIPMVMLAIPATRIGLRGFFANQVVILDHESKRTVHNCYDPRQTVELFAANCTVALSNFRSSRGD